MMEFLSKSPFPIMWFMDYIPSYFRFILAACTIFKMFSNVYYYNLNYKPGVLKHRRDENWKYRSRPLDTDFQNNYWADIGTVQDRKKIVKQKLRKK